MLQQDINRTEMIVKGTQKLSRYAVIPDHFLYQSTLKKVPIQYQDAIGIAAN